MTTTSHLYAFPDFFNTTKECESVLREKKQTNLRYKNFTQTIFHAGDVEQFEEYRDKTNFKNSILTIDLTDNLYKEYSLYKTWDKYEKLNSLSVDNTFLYMFYKFKKGIFIRIKNNKLAVFLPFSNANYRNEWSHLVKIHPRFRRNNKINQNVDTRDDFINMLRYISEIENRNFNPKKINRNINEWYANNSLIRFEYPINESDHNVSIYKNFIQELCDNRIIPDIEFFLNRRDYPLLSRNCTEPYNHIWGKDKNLISHNYNTYSPILSMSSTNNHSDILIPTYQDWTRVQGNVGKYFEKTCEHSNDLFDTEWEEKIPTAIFRGSSTGAGVTIETNMRLKASYLSTVSPIINGRKILDAGITKWQLRPRKHENSEYIDTIDISQLPFKTVNYMTYNEQSKYKYILNIDGHVSALRLSIELAMKSVILLVESEWKLWFSDMIQPFVHYIPINKDLSDLFEKIEWCIENDEKCKQIAKNARNFYDTFLCKKSILDYMQKILIEIKNHNGVYTYNSIDIKDDQMQRQKNIISKMKRELYNKYASNNHNLDCIQHTEKIKNIFSCVSNKNNRDILLLQSLKTIINIQSYRNQLNDIYSNGAALFSNKLSNINEGKIYDYNVIYKETTNKKKKYEHIHETFTGLQCVNNLIENIPNFSYIFGMIENDDNLIVISEKIMGQTMFEYFNSNEYTFQDFLFITIQLCLILEYCQKQCNFIHYDLTPWNIIISKSSTFKTIEYPISHDRIYKIHTNIIPIIIDYGKSSFVDTDNIQYGMINMFTYDKSQDILTFLISSLHSITTNHIDKQNVKYIFELTNILIRKCYNCNQVNSFQTLKQFLTFNKKYSVLVNWCERKRCDDLNMSIFNYIMDTFNGKYNFPIKLSDELSQVDYKCNNRVMNELLLCNLPDKQLQIFNSYINRIFDENDMCNSSNPFLLSDFKPYNIYFLQKIYEDVCGTLIFLKNYSENISNDIKEYIEGEYKKIIDKYENVLKFITKTHADIILCQIKHRSIKILTRDDNMNISTNLSYITNILNSHEYRDKFIQKYKNIDNGINNEINKNTNNEIEVINDNDLSEYYLLVNALLAKHNNVCGLKNTITECRKIFKELLDIPIDLIRYNNSLIKSVINIFGGMDDI